MSGFYDIPRKGAGMRTSLTTSVTSVFVREVVINIQSIDTIAEDIQIASRAGVFHIEPDETRYENR